LPPRYGQKYRSPTRWFPHCTPPERRA
jgi:hypothetical protein